MNYYLNDIKTLLTAQGFSSIYINAFKEINTSSPIQDFVVLYAEGGQSDVNTTSNKDFAVYVYSQKNQTARENSMTIYNYLQGYAGGVATAEGVQIRRIITRNEPIPFITEAKNIYCHLATYTAQINDSDLLLVK